MAEIIRMPRMSDTMEEGVIASWLKKEGDSIKSGDVLAEVETDKATMELESYEDGVLLHIAVKEKDNVPVDGVIAIIGDKEEDISNVLKNIKSEASESETKKDTETQEKESTAAKAQESEEIDTSDINASIITMPKMSDTMEEGTISQWIKKVGDKVESGDILAEVDTDKATMELEAFEEGTLLYTGPKDGESVPVDGVIAVIGEEGADFETLLKSHESKKKEKVEKPEEVTQEKEELPEQVSEEKKVRAPVPADEPSTERADGRLKASPLAKRLAKEMGYDIRKIKGSGDQGRIIKRDVENYEPVAEEPVLQPSGEEKGFTLPSVVGEESYEEVTNSQMRKTIAKRLAQSKFSAPHFYLTMEINMDRTIEARKSINELSPVKISFNDIILKACAAALRQHPKVNSSWREDKIRYNKHIHIGVAVAVEEGLLVPVLRFADNKSLSHIAAEVKELGNKARNKQLQPEEWEGNTFTVSNLGMFGIEEFTAIINPPDACILAVGGIKETAIVKDGKLVPGNVMKVTLSCDHRVVDGATGAAFLQTLKGLLEDPVRIMI